MVRFHSILFRTSSLDEACNSLSSDLSVFRCHLYFVRQYGRHYKKRLMGKGRQRQIEKIISNNMSQYPIVKQYLGVKKVREIAQKVTALSEDKYLEQSRRFFHGHVPIPYAQFMEYLRALPPAPEGFYDDDL